MATSPDSPPNPRDILTAERENLDADVCRICQCGGSRDNPLFHPCRCRGSLKFVHQNCLTEWLHRIEKRDCNICQIRLGFTKLYDARMPKRIPIAVFLRRAMLHLRDNMFVRALLVSFVWLLCVPLAVRYIWHVMFWLADGDWARDHLLKDKSMASGGLADQQSLLSGIPFLKNLFPSTSLNQFVIGVLEGQLIMLPVVVGRELFLFIDNQIFHQGEEPIRHERVFRWLFDLFWNGIPRAANNEEENHFVENIDEETKYTIGNINDEDPFIRYVNGYPVVHTDVQTPQGQGAQAQNPDVIVVYAKGSEEFLEFVAVKLWEALAFVIYTTSTIFLAVVLPYYFGKLALICIARPLDSFPVQLAFATARTVLPIPDTILGFGFSRRETGKSSISVSASVWQRLGVHLVFLSANAHATLQWLEAKTNLLLNQLFGALFGRNWQPIGISTTQHALYIIQDVAGHSINYFVNGADLGVWDKISPNSVAYWDAKDITLAVLAGHACLAFIYVTLYSQLAPIFPQLRESFIGLFQQTRIALRFVFNYSVTFVLLVIFCGFFADVALLPLFRNATLESRLTFITTNPMTSIILHWLVGISYMLHVGFYCPTIERAIRPDNRVEHAHVDRHGLGLSIMACLHRFASNLVIYGVITTILGSIVWALCYAAFPIHLSSESGLDILFCNFAIYVVHPNNALNDLLEDTFKWWHCKCVRILGLSDHPLGEGKPVHASVTDDAQYLNSTSYMAPWFKIRIGMLIVLDCAFASLASVGIIIIPSPLGKYLFSPVFAPATMADNIYMSALGLYVLCTVLDLAAHIPLLEESVRNALSSDTDSPWGVPAGQSVDVLGLCLKFCRYAGGAIYSYTGSTILLPLYLGIFFESCILKLIRNLFHSCLSVAAVHRTHFAESWLLGFLCLRYWRPYAWRYSVVPSLPVFIALLVNGLIGLSGVFTIHEEVNEQGFEALVMRYQGPFMLALMVVAQFCILMKRRVKKWVAVVRDEEYLIGKRLNNFRTKHE